MSATTITVTHVFAGIDGTPGSGTVEAQLSAPLTNGTQTVSGAVTATLASNGSLSMTVPANNDPSSTPQTTSYTFTLRISGSPQVEYAGIVVPFDAAGGTVDLGTLLPTAQPVG